MVQVQVPAPTDPQVPPKRKKEGFGPKADTKITLATTPPKRSANSKSGLE